MARRVANRSQRRQHFREQRFARRSIAEVGGNHAGDALGVLADATRQFREIGPPSGKLGSAVTQECLALTVKYGAEIRTAGVRRGPCGGARVHHAAPLLGLPL